MTTPEFTDDIGTNHERALEHATADVSFGHWIDGESRDATTGETFETTDPATGGTITTVPRGDADDIDAAVVAARSAFEGEWGDTTPADRSRAMLDWLSVLREHTDELALLESLDSGKPLSYARFEVQKAFEFIEYYATIVRGDEGATIPLGDRSHTFTIREPYGVAGLITPWNYPVLLATWKLGPALAAGNTVVLKPAEDTPLTATRIAQLSKDVLPDGTINVVHGYGEEAGAPLTSHAGVDKLSFTGEDVTGEKVMEAAASNILPVTLELGGKSPFIVFPDADIEQAVKTVAGGIFYNTGQSCDACSRVLVHEEVHDEFVDGLVEAAESRSVGDPLTDGTAMGPLASEQQFEKVTGYIELGEEEATLVAGGAERLVGEEFDDGWYVRPTVFDDVENDMRIAQEEIFGPVETIITFSSYEEAIEIANDVEFGLSSGVATRNLSLAHRAAKDIEAGTVSVNEYGRTVPGAPFGGFKRSGIGRELSQEALHEYSQAKTVKMSLDDPEL